MFEIPATMVQSGISPSRTYMIGVYDPVSPNEIRFEKVILPESARNTIQDAKRYYLLDNLEEASTIRIMVCIAIEEYLSATHEIFKVLPEEEKEDIELTLKMLYDWNAKQKKPSESYSVALNTLLQRVTLADDFNDKFTKLKGKVSG